VDHDVQPEAMVTPVGLLVPTRDELFVYGITAKVTSDCLADCLERWWDAVRPQGPQITTLVIHLDHGPETQSRRTQFMQRMVTFAQQTGRTIRWASYPPYHSKYHPIERCWGILENHGNGALLDSIDAVIPFAPTMTWQGAHPVGALVTPTYETGVKLTKAAMQAVEARLTRLPGLEKWFVDISPTVAPRLSG
jgi:hypothetical protein